MSANIISTTLGNSTAGNIYTSPLWVQSFNSPSPTTQTAITPTVSNFTGTIDGVSFTNEDVIESYSHIDLAYGASQTGGIIYDPNSNGVAGCSSGSGMTGGSGTLTFPTNCVGNWVLTSPSTKAQQNTVNSVPNMVTSFSILFDQPTTQAAFDIAVASPGANQGANTLVTVYFSDGSFCGLNASGVCVANTASSGYHFTVSNANAGTTEIGFTSASNTPIEEIVLATSGGNEVANYTWNVNVSNIEANAPEPGTLGLIGLGLAGVGYFARRRKSA